MLVPVAAAAEAVLDVEVETALTAVERVVDTMLLDGTTAMMLEDGSWTVEDEVWTIEGEIGTLVLLGLVATMELVLVIAVVVELMTEVVELTATVDELAIPGMHWEYQELQYWQKVPGTHVVSPVHS